jgi:hypothetical protein
MCRSYTEQLVVLAVHLSYPICLYSMSIVYRSLLIIVNVLSLYDMKNFYSITNLYYCIQNESVNNIFLSLFIHNNIGI